MKRFSLGFAALAMLIVGCTKDIDTDIVKNELVRGELVTMNLVIEESRLDRNDEGKLAWSEGDQVAVVLNNNGTYALDTEVYTVNHTDGTVEIPSNAAYAVYPAAIAKSVEGSVVTLDLPQSITVATPAEVFDHNPMKGTVKGANVIFKNMVGYMKLPVTGTGTLSAVTVKSEIFNGFKPLSRACTVDLSASNAAVVMSETNTARAFVQVKFSTPLDLSTSPVVYLPVPANTYNNIAVVAETDKGATSIYGSNSHTVATSTVQPVVAAAVNISEHVPATPTMLSGDSGDSKMDYANTYIVPPTAGNYAFEATLCDGCELKGGVTAEIVWAEEAGMFYDIHYDPATNVISFKSNGNEGNALVALTKNDFTSKTVVWSWLLWCTDAPETIAIVGDKGTGSTYKLMDRVIGATWAPTGTLTDQRTEKGWNEQWMMNGSVSSKDATDGCGLYYQYQNMMPYPRLKDIDAVANETKDDRSNTRIAVQYGFHQYAQYWTSSSACGEVSMDENAQLRTPASYNLSYQYGAGNNAWCFTPLKGHNSSAANFVQDQEGVYCLWGGITAVASDLTVKTTHDPCPAGYIIDNASGIYHYLGANDPDKIAGYVRNPENSEVHNTTTGYKFYGMYITGGTNSAGVATDLYTPTCSNRNQTIVKTIGTYANMGYIYFYNTNNVTEFTYTYDSTEYVGYYGANNQFGAAGTNGAGTAGAAISKPWGNNFKKITNAQAYPVRCRQKGF